MKATSPANSPVIPAKTGIHSEWIFAFAEMTVGGNPNPTRFKKFGHGFTLIELLVVIVIISIIATFAVLTISTNQNKQLESFAKQLANTITLAEQEAMLRPATLGLKITKSSFQFYEYRPNKPTPWYGLSDSLLGVHRIPNDIQMTLKIGGKSVTDPLPRLIISPSGDITSFTIFISKKGDEPAYKVIGEENGTIKTKLIQEGESPEQSKDNDDIDSTTSGEKENEE